MAAAEYHLLGDSHQSARCLPRAQFVQTVGGEESAPPVQAHAWATPEPVGVRSPLPLILEGVLSSRKRSPRTLLGKRASWL